MPYFMRVFLNLGFHCFVLLDMENVHVKYRAPIVLVVSYKV